MTDTERDELFGELVQDWEAMGDRERRLIREVANRLYLGQKAYGELTNGKKRWCREALEEAMDGMVYLGAALQDLADEEQNNANS